MTDKSKPPTLPGCRRREAYRFVARIRWILLVRDETRSRFRMHFSHDRFSFREPIFPQRHARNAGDWYFCFALPRRNFRFSREDGRAWLFFGRVLWPNVNLRNLCRCVSFGLVESPDLSSRCYLDCLRRGPLTFEECSREIFNIRFSDG